MRTLMILVAGGLLLMCSCDALVPAIGDKDQPCSSTGTCKPGLVCVAQICCRENAYQQCAADGNIYWFSSCDSQLEQVKECSLACEECLDAGPECKAKGNWAVGTKCIACVGHWDPAGGCTQCRYHWEDKNDNCGTCPGNWDPNQDCKTCRNHWEGATCETCPLNWDIDQDCGACLEGWAGDDCDKVPSCDLQPDFSICEKKTTPDYWYDICIDNECIAPYVCQDAACNPPGLAFTLPDTGQHECYDHQQEQACSNPPDTSQCATTPFCGQDAQYGWDKDHNAATRFTPRKEPVPPQTLVEDLVTGLIWQGCTKGRDGANCGNGTSEPANFADAMTYCEGLSWAGHKDWRLPTRLELQSLVDFGRNVAPFTYFDELDYGSFPGTEPAQYWTSSAYAQDSTNAHIIHFGYGSGGMQSKDEDHFVRCVRRGP